MRKREAGRSGQTARAREMAAVLEACDRSDVSQAAFARRRGIPAGTLAWWRHALRPRRQARGPRRATFVEITPPAGAAMKPEPAAGFEVVLPHGTLVRVPAAFEARALKRLLAVLGRPC